MVKLTTKLIYLVFYSCLLVFVQVHLNQARGIQLDADALSNNFCGETQVVQYRVMHSSEGTAEIVEKKAYTYYAI